MNSSLRIITVIVFMTGVACLVEPGPAQSQTTDLLERCRRNTTVAKIQTAGHGDPENDYCVALAYDAGQLGLPKDPARALALFRSAADLGYAPAQTTLGERYARGAGVPQDFGRALDLWRKAASQGFAGAQNDLGAAYMNGWAVKKDNNEAIKWFRLAANQGDAKAQNNLTALEHQGSASPRSEPAQDLYEQGGRLYSSGQKEAAANPFLAAAQAGNSLAQQQIAWHYANGVGVPQSWTEAAKWYRQSADQGNTAAMWNLGLLYEMGHGVTEDWTLV